MDYTVQLPKETADMVRGLSGFIREVKRALSDGWQPGEDLPALMSAAITNLAPALSGMDQLDDEAKANPKAMVVAAGILAAEIYDAIQG